MTINRYRYFYACAFDLYGDHLFAFVDRMAELDHAESTVNLYLSCINDVAKAMATAGNAACDLDEKRALELVAAMGWDGMDKIPRDLCKVHDEALCGLSCRARRDAGAFGSRDAPGVGRAMDAYAKPTGRDATHAFAVGDADTILARVAEYVDAGVSKFILRPLGCDDDAIPGQTRLLIEQVLRRAEARWPRRPKVTTTDR
jgi:hypothetical protein